MGYGSLTAWAEATGQEMKEGKLLGTEADPKFTGPLNTVITDPYKLNTLRRYTLRPDSPLRNRGIAAGSITGKNLPVTDFFGNPVPNGTGTEPGIYDMN